MEPEILNLRWDSFDANTRVTLNDLRKDMEFCDITLACGGKQVKAHKVILAGGSSFFKEILQENPHPHPLIYLKGIKYSHLLSILDFVYKGEASIVQEDVESFLDAAAELKIKGLGENKDSKETNGILSESTSKNYQKHAGDVQAGNIHSYNTTGTVYSDEAHATDKLQRNSAEEMQVYLKTEAPDIDDDGFYMGGVEASKCEITVDNDMCDGTVVEAGEEMSLCGYTGYVEQLDQIDPSFSRKLKPFCYICEKSFKSPADLKRHLRKHTGEQPFQCIVCNRKFTRKGSMERHMKVHKSEI